MAIVPNTEFVGKISAPNADYPYGSARNVTTPGDGTGTPWVANLVNDIWGYVQGLLAEAGITPTGDPDTAIDSQYIHSMRRITTGAWQSRTALAAAVTVRLGEMHVVQGGAAADDGGLGFYRIVAAGTGSPDGVNFINIPAADGGSGLQAKLISGSILHQAADLARLAAAGPQAFAGKLQTAATADGDPAGTLVTKGYVLGKITAPSLVRRLEITEPTVYTESNNALLTAETGWVPVCYPINGEATMHIGTAVPVSAYPANSRSAGGPCGLIAWIGSVGADITPSASTMVITEVIPVWSGATLTGVTLRGCRQAVADSTFFDENLQEAAGYFEETYVFGTDVDYKTFATHYIAASEYAKVEIKTRQTGAGSTLRIEVMVKVSADGWNDGISADHTFASSAAVQGVQYGIQ